MKDIFISYSSADVDVASDVADTISRNGWDCFLAHRDIHAGEEYAERIVDAIDHAKLMVLIMSKMSNDSQHVMREVERAVSIKLPILVYYTEDVVLSKPMEYFVKTQQWIQKNEFQKERLVCGIQGVLTKNEVELSFADNNEPVRKADAKAKNKLIIMLVIAGVIIIALMAIVISMNKRIDTLMGAGVSETRFSELALGDTVKLGSYNNEPIEWRVIHINDDGTATLISKQCLCLKAFDAPEGGRYNEYDGVDYWSYDNHLVYDVELNGIIRGSNDWSKSNIRTWLNARTELVSYEDQPPTRKALCEGLNYYDEEPGFLYGWSEEDMSVLVPAVIYTRSNEPADEKYVETTDYVYLLGEDEVGWFAEAGFSPYAGLTDVALESNDTTYVESDQQYYDTDTVNWWLRDPVTSVPEGVGTRVLLFPMMNLENKEALLTEYDTAGLGIHGVRPVVTISMQ